MKANLKNKNNNLITGLLILAICLLPACGGSDYTGAVTGNLPGQPRGGDANAQVATLDYASASCSEETASLDIVGSGLSTAGLAIKLREAGDDGTMVTISLDGGDARLMGASEFSASLSLVAIEVAAGDYDLVLVDTNDNEVSRLRTYIPEANVPCGNSPEPVIYSVSHACDGTAGLNAIIHGQNLAFSGRDLITTEVIVTEAENTQNVASEDFTDSWAASDTTIILPVHTKGATRTYQVNVAGAYSNTFSVEQPTLGQMGCASGTNTGSIRVEGVQMTCGGPGLIQIAVLGSGFEPLSGDLNDTEIQIEYIAPYGAEFRSTLGELGSLFQSASESEVVVELPDSSEIFEVRFYINHDGERSNPFTTSRPIDLPSCN